MGIGRCDTLRGIIENRSRCRRDAGRWNGAAVYPQPGRRVGVSWFIGKGSPVIGSAKEVAAAWASPIKPASLSPAAGNMMEAARFGIREILNLDRTLKSSSPESKRASMLCYGS